jgi:hypothetical protein
MNSKRYWLRFGITLAAIGVVITLAFRLATLAGVDLDGAFNAYIVAMVATGPGFILAIMIFSIMGCSAFASGGPALCNNELLQGVIIVSSVAVTYFLIGAILGWIYGKIMTIKNTQTGLY